MIICKYFQWSAYGEVDFFYSFAIIDVRKGKCQNSVNIGHGRPPQQEKFAKKNADGEAWKIYHDKKEAQWFFMLGVGGWVVAQFFVGLVLPSACHDRRQATTGGVLFKKVVLVRKNHKEKLVFESVIFDKALLRPATLLKKRPQHWRFPVNFAKFLEHLFYRVHQVDWFCEVFLLCTDFTLFHTPLHRYEGNFFLKITFPRERI